MPSAKTLRVYANPWQSLDHEGLPAGACACDPDEHTPARRFVGATLTSKETRAADPRRGVTARHRIGFEFSSTEQELPNTVYYTSAIKRGELIAADIETAKACGFAPDAFRDPASVLDEEQRSASARYFANYGELPPWAQPAAPDQKKPAKGSKGGE